MACWYRSLLEHPRGGELPPAVMPSCGAAVNAWQPIPAAAIFLAAEFPEIDVLDHLDRWRDSELGGLRLESEQLGQQRENALGVRRALFRHAPVAIDEIRVHEAPLAIGRHDIKQAWVLACRGQNRQ